MSTNEIRDLFLQIDGQELSIMDFKTKIEELILDANCGLPPWHEVLSTGKMYWDYGSNMLYIKVDVKKGEESLNRRKYMVRQLPNKALLENYCEPYDGVDEIVGEEILRRMKSNDKEDR